MNEFVIESNVYLSRNTRAFFHTNYLGFRQPGNPDFLNYLKNDSLWDNAKLPKAKRILKKTLISDLPKVAELLQLRDLTVCVVPRAKAEQSYSQAQLQFIATVREYLAEAGGLADGTGFIRRHTDTKTTHLTYLKQPINGLANEGEMPFPGITSRTCHLSDDIA